MGILAARLGAINFTRALSYAKRPLSVLLFFACRVRLVLHVSRVACVASRLVMPRQTYAILIVISIISVPIKKALYALPVLSIL